MEIRSDKITFMNTSKPEPTNESTVATSTFALEAENLSKIVTSPEGMLTILDQVSLQVSHGERIAIIGASGAGKSTLLGLLAGLDLPTSGKVWLDDHELTGLDEDGRAALRADKVGFVFQSFHLIPSLTALENVMLPLELQGHANAAEQAENYLQRVELGDRARHYPRQMSGGEQQRVAIARAFATRPAILFADEPTGNLDSETGKRIIDLLFELNAEQGTTLIMATHDVQLSQLCKQSIQLEAGRLVSGELD